MTASNEMKSGEMPELNIGSQIVRSKQSLRRRKELVVWLILAILSLSPIPINASYYSYRSLTDLFAQDGFLILLSLFFFLFPLLFEQIFDTLPFEAIRQRRSGSSDYFAYGAAHPRSDQGTQGIEAGVDRAFRPLRSDDLLAINADSSARISQGIYKRAGVYLLVGVAVAFSGLFFFYVLSVDEFSYVVDMGSGRVLDRRTGQPINSRSMWDFVDFLPTLGILLFIELIAFFFLRQYRAAMDEFRYFEAVKRRREEVRVLFQLVAETGQADPLDIVRAGSYFSDPAVLSSGQTTEILEARKLEKNELALLEKMIDALSVGRR